MKVNTQRFLPLFYPLLPDGYGIFRSNAGDFAVYRKDDPASAIAFLSLIRPSHRALRIDGYVGRVSLPNGAAPERIRTRLSLVTLTHLLNVDDLRASSFLDDRTIDEDIAVFLRALEGVLDRLRGGENLRGMMHLASDDIFIGPLMSGND